MMFLQIVPSIKIITFFFALDIRRIHLPSTSSTWFRQRKGLCTIRLRSGNRRSRLWSSTSLTRFSSAKRPQPSRRNGYETLQCHWILFRRRHRPEILSQRSLWQRLPKMGRDSGYPEFAIAVQWESHFTQRRSGFFKCSV